MSGIVSAALAGMASLTAAVRDPIARDATAGQTIQLVFEVTDNGTPALTRYRRVTVSVK